MLVIGSFMVWSRMWSVIQPSRKQPERIFSREEDELRNDPAISRREVETEPQVEPKVELEIFKPHLAKLSLLEIIKRQRKSRRNRHTRVHFAESNVVRCGPTRFLLITPHRGIADQ